MTEPHTEPEGQYPPGCDEKCDPGDSAHGHLAARRPVETATPPGAVRLQRAALGHSALPRGSAAGK